MVNFLPSSSWPNRFWNANFPPVHKPPPNISPPPPPPQKKISPSKRVFEKYKSRGLFSEFYGMLSRSPVNWQLIWWDNAGSARPSMNQTSARGVKFRKYGMVIYRSCPCCGCFRLYKEFKTKGNNNHPRRKLNHNTDMQSLVYNFISDQL